MQALVKLEATGDHTSGMRAMPLPFWTCGLGSSGQFQGKKVPTAVKSHLLWRTLICAFQALEIDGEGIGVHEGRPGLPGEYPIPLAEGVAQFEGISPSPVSVTLDIGAQDARPGGFPEVETEAGLIGGDTDCAAFWSL